MTRKPYKVEHDGRTDRLRNKDDLIQHLSILLQIHTGEEPVITKDGHDWREKTRW